VNHIARCAEQHAPAIKDDPTRKRVAIPLDFCICGHAHGGAPCAQTSKGSTTNSGAVCRNCLRGSRSKGRFLAEREYASDLLRNEITSAQKVEADLRVELATAERHRREISESLSAEKTLLEDKLRQSHDERAKLQREIESMRREAETALASKRMENAVMRERINDVAAKVARLTSVLEGPHNPIDAILAGETARPTLGPAAPHISNGHAPIASGEARSTLADRIRALQSRASLGTGKRT